jgi:hypothetical protein
MNIDERLDRLTERHEALTQSVELITHQTAANAVAIDALTKDIAGLKDAVNILVQLAASHENRIDRLERN